jgi:tRNA-dihydrouridine synthase A
VLQLGGNDPAALARCAKLGEAFGYQAINLNCGCPSDRVLQGAFGACLMAQPALVAQCVAAMRDAVDVPVTVKHRIGLDHVEDYAFVRDFVGTVRGAGCSHFIVHARNAWLDGLNPKENREIPPLRYEVVHRLAADFPDCAFELNGGLQSLEHGREASVGLAGAMFGRLAYHQPYMLAAIDGGLPVTRSAVVETMVDYLRSRRAGGVEVRHLARHLLGLYHGEPAARRWRRMLSDSELLAANDPSLLLQARDAVETAAQRGVAETA